MEAGAALFQLVDDRDFILSKRGAIAHPQTQLRRFTLDRMIAILGKLDEDVKVNVTFRPSAARRARRAACAVRLCARCR